MTPQAIICLNKFIDKLKIAVPYLVVIHKSLFYIYGRYYSLGRRLAGVDYAKVIYKNIDITLFKKRQVIHLIFLHRCMEKGQVMVLLGA